jgi:hypothetical protein
MGYNAVNIRNRLQHPLPNSRSLIVALIDDKWHKMVWIPQTKEIMYLNGEQFSQKIQLKDEEDLTYQLRYENWKI